ncbi:MAG: hypothetical protein AAB227_07570, partial [Pseudomonadota bacterium]
DDFLLAFAQHRLGRRDAVEGAAEMPRLFVQPAFQPVDVFRLRQVEVGNRDARGIGFPLALETLRGCASVIPENVSAMARPAAETSSLWLAAFLLLNSSMVFVFSFGFSASFFYWELGSRWPRDGRSRRGES